MINNAGAARGSDRVPVVELDPELWRVVLDVNLNGAFYMSQIFGRKLIEQGEGGAIINISSIAGKMLGPEHGGLCVVKGRIAGIDGVDGAGDRTARAFA